MTCGCVVAGGTPATKTAPSGAWAATRPDCAVEKAPLIDTSAKIASGPFGPGMGKAFAAFELDAAGSCVGEAAAAPVEVDPPAGAVELTLTAAVGELPLELGLVGERLPDDVGAGWLDVQAASNPAARHVPATSRTAPPSRPVRAAEVRVSI